MSEEAEILTAATERVGTILHGKYHIDSVLGVGGMATVYAATHRNRKRFAIKMLHPEFSVRRDVRERFVREGYAANSVNHPGAVVVLDDDVDETGAAFLVMELLDGVTVDAVYGASSKPIPVRESLAIAHQLLDILEAAHQKDIVHRDIKPANLFLLKDGQVKVVDFGIARLRDPDAGLNSTRTGATLGTPAFMAPEQALATPGEIDARTDIWAAGATLFTMLSAHIVHEGQNARQIMIRAATKPARSLGSVAPDVPAPVVELVARALAFERSERWPSAAAMRDAVAEAHQSLFGELTRAPLGALVERTATRFGTSPTEPSPIGGDTPGPVSPEIAASLLPASRAVVTTASTPVEAAKDGRNLPKIGLGLAAATASILGAGWLFSHPKSDSGNTTPAGAPTMEARSTASTLPEPPPPVTSNATAPGSGGTAAPPASVLPAASARAAARGLPARATSGVPHGTPPLATASSAPAKSPAPEPNNPLKLELQ